VKDIPAGEYYVQALVNRYETFKRSDGHTIKMPMDQGEGQKWTASRKLLQQAREDARRSRAQRRHPHLDGSGDSADRAAERHGRRSSIFASRTSG